MTDLRQSPASSRTAGPTFAESIGALAVSAVASPPASERRQDGDRTAPFCGVVLPSTHTPGSLELRFNGFPPEPILLACKSAGLRWAPSSRAWYGQPTAVTAAAQQIDDAYPGSLAVYSTAEKGLAAWAALPQRREAKDGKGKAGKGKAAPAAADPIDAMRKARELAAMGASEADAVTIATGDPASADVRAAMARVLAGTSKGQGVEGVR